MIQNELEAGAFQLPLFPESSSREDLNLSREEEPKSNFKVLDLEEPEKEENSKNTGKNRKLLGYGEVGPKQKQTFSALAWKIGNQ